MADISLVIDVQQNGVTSAVKNIKTLEGNVKLLSDRFKGGSLSQRQYYKGLLQLAEASGKSEKELRKYATQIRAADKAQKQETATKKAAAQAARAEAEATKAYAQARREATAANLRFNAESRTSAKILAEEKAARRALRMEFKEGYAAQVQYRAARMRLSQAEREGIITAEQATIAQKNLGIAVQQGGRHMSRTGVMTQQAGYQIGDFLVQVQGGTNPMVAFGQQATQLVGALYMLPSATIAAKVGIMGLSISVGALIAAAGILIPLATAIGAAWMRTRKNVDDSSDSVKTLDSNMKDLNSTLDRWIKLKRAASLGITLEELLGVGNLEEAKAKVNAAQKIVDSFAQMVTSPGYGAAGGIDIASLLGIGRGSSLEDAKAVLAEAEKALAAIQAKVRQQAREEAEAAMNDAWEQQKREQALAEYEAGQEVIAARKEWVEEAIQIFRDAQERMRNEEMARTEKQLNTLFRSRTLYYSIRYSGEEEVMSQSVAPKTKVPKMPSAKELLAMGWTEEDLKRMGISLPSSGGGGRGTTKTDPKEKALEAYNKLVATYDEVEAKALKVAAAQKTLNEAESLGVITSQQSKDALEAYTRSLEDAKSPMLDLANTASQSLSSAFMAIVEGSKSAADAFKDMASAIIKQAFEMAVINPIMNSLFGGVSGFSKLPSFFANANGNVFSGGSHIKAYADGGVVGGPTFFPMSGGKTGLMGEAGPEAIMPLKRGANGKLGVQMEGNSGGSVVIHQSFNFQANGDDSVKRIIASEAPKIASMTQRQIMDQRRRGGAMKSAFG